MYEYVYAPELGRVGVGGAAHAGQQARQGAQRGRQAAAAERPQRAHGPQHAHVQRDVARHVQHCVYVRVELAVIRTYSRIY